MVFIIILFPSQRWLRPSQEVPVTSLFLWFLSPIIKKTQLYTPGKFIEHAKVHNNLYGTSKETVHSILRANKLPILDVDVEGVKQIKAQGF